MSSACLLLGVALAATGQIGPRPRPQAAQLDPFLWEEVRSLVEQAWAAEQDPKRGPGNAETLLKNARVEFASDRHRTALDLRRAATSLRQVFRTAQQFSEVQREAQALSTYSRLDLAEPGLATDLQRALLARQRAIADEDSPIVVPELGIRAAVLSRNASLDAPRFARRLRARLKKVGVRLKTVAPAEADFILKIGAKNVETRGDTRQVTVRIDLEQVDRGRTAWRHALFRTTAAPTAQEALDVGLEWLARIGGRDLLFRYLADGPLPELMPLSPRRRHHH